MAEPKTQGRRSGGEKSGKAGAKTRKEPAKAAKASAKPTGSGAGAKAAKSGGRASKGNTGAAKSSGTRTSKAAKSPAARAAKPTRSAKPAAKPKKVTARTAADAAKAAAPAPAPAPKVAAPAAAPTAAKPAARPPAKKKVVAEAAKGYFAAVAARDAAAVASQWHREGIYDSVPMGVFRGPDAVRRLYEETFAAMPDMQLTVERITADDRVAAVQWRASGTFSGGPFQGIEPTGRRIELRGIDCLEVEDGKVLRNTSVYDGAAVARGMGLLPQEDSGADRALRAGFNTVTKLRRVVAARSGGAR